MTKAAWARASALCALAWIRVRASAPGTLAWIRARAAEKSTWIGLAIIASAVGKSTWADHLTHLGNVVPMILAAVGAIAVGASTSDPAAPPQP